jgi:ketosteroid isomerase-like protein
MTRVSQRNVEIVRGCIESFQRGDYATAMDALDPEIEYDLTHFPDGEVYRGHDGVGEAFRIWIGTWEDYRMELDELIDAGDSEVIALVRELGRGKASGIELERPTAGVWTLRNGKVIRIRFYERRQAALEALGLAETAT